jgi:hypothetical protein
MNIRFGDYLLESGWGGIGFYDIDKAIGLESMEIRAIDLATGKKSTDAFRHIITEDAVICGTGSGYEEFIFDGTLCSIIATISNTNKDKIQEVLDGIKT